MKTITTHKTLIALSISMLLGANYNLANAETNILVNGETITLPDDTKVDYQINTDEASAIGLEVKAQGTANAKNLDLSMTSDIPFVTGVSVQRGSTANLTGNSHIKVTATAESEPTYPYVIGLSVSNGTVTADKIDIEVTSNVNSAKGLMISGNSDVNLGSGSTITASTTKSGSNAYNVAAAVSGGKLVADHLTITGHNRGGLSVIGNAQVDLKSGSKIVVTGEQGSATTAGKGSHGLNLSSNSRGKPTFKADHLTIDMHEAENNATAIYVDGYADADIGPGSHIITGSGGKGINTGSFDSTSTQTATINFMGTEAEHNRIDVTGGKYPVGVRVYNANRTVNLSNTDIFLAGHRVIGVEAFNDGNVNAENLSIDYGSGDHYSATGVESSWGAKVKLTGDTKINSGFALKAYNGGNITVTGKANINGYISAKNDGTKIDMTMDEGSSIVGDISATDGASVDVVLAEGSTLRGGVNGNVNLTMADGGTWDVGNSELKDVNLGNATLNLYHLSNGIRRMNPVTLTVDNLSGNTTINAKAMLVEGKGDLIKVKGNVEGEHKIFFENHGSAKTTGDETLVVVEMGNNDNGNIELGRKLEAGGYIYDLREVKDNTQAKQPRVLADSAADTTEATDAAASSPIKLELYATNKKTSSAQGATSFLNIGYLTNYIENQTLLQRMGDLRNNGAGNSGAWVKGFGGKLFAFSGQAFDGFDLTYSGLQVGADTDIGVDNGKFLVGMVAGYTHTNPYYGQGSGSGKNYSLGYYTTYLADAGFYVDSVLKFNHMKNQFTVKDTAGDLVKGTGKTSGISLSAEVGQRFWFSENKDGFYLEPQAQLTYGYQTGDTVKASNGLKIGLSHYNSLLGRASLIAGYQLDNLNLYAKAGIVREMNGKTNYQFNDMAHEHYTLRSNWIDTGIGMNWNILNSHNIYAELDYADGQNFDKEQFNLGYRFTF